MLTVIPSFASSFSSYNYFTTRITGGRNGEAKPAQVRCSTSSQQRHGIEKNLMTAFEPAVYDQDYHINDEFLSMKHAQKLRDVRNVLKAAERQNSFQDLMLVDAIQRQGIDHHFQEEIEAVLRRHYLEMKSWFYESRRSLHEVSLSFRLLRQEGYYVPPDVFTKFMNEERRFDLNNEKSDIKALIELYEAAQLSIEGEDILDAAAKSSSQLLNAWTRYLDQTNTRIIKNTLNHPYRKSLARFKPMNLMTHEFEGTNGVQKSLRELSHAEFYMSQSIRRQELLQISNWWKDLGIAKELKHARDQPLKWYTWPMACLSDLSLSDERVDLTKAISFIYLIDDIFDLYGKPEDLTLFTQAVNRWELAAVEELPDYMKACFRALYNITNEAAINIQKKHGFNPLQTLQKTWADLCNAFLVESRWFTSNSRNLPKADEYLKNGIVSSGVHVVLVYIFCLLGFGTRSKSQISLDDASAIISSTATILRLWDDLGSSRDEGQNGYDGSYINYYLNQHQGRVTVEFAREHVFNLISDEWKRLNMACLQLTQSSTCFQKASLNLARMVPLMYSYDDNQQLPDLQSYMNSMLCHDLL